MRTKRDKLWFWIFVIPALVAFVIVVVIPFFMGLYYSFTDWSAVGGTPQWVGIKNYKNMFSDYAFRYAFIRTFLFTFLSVITINAIALVLAFLVTRELKLKNFYRAGFFVPNLIGGLILGYIWQFIFKSILPVIGEGIGWDWLANTLFLADANIALFAVVIAFTWQYAGYIMMIYVAAILNIPQELLEASDIDGAGPFQKLKSITMPLIAQAFTITTFMTLVSSFKQFDIIRALTNGGPSLSKMVMQSSGFEKLVTVNSTELLAVHIYNIAFKFNKMAEGQARAVVFFVVLSVISIAQVYYNKRKEVEM